MLALLPIVVALVAGGASIDQYRTERSSMASAYARAERALRSGDYGVAIASFAEAGTYRDAERRRSEAIAEIAPYRALYLTGADALESGDYDLAVGSLLVVVRAIPDYEDAADLLAEARAQATNGLLAEADAAELRRDWLAVETALDTLIAENPDDGNLLDRRATLSRTHSPMVFARDGSIYMIGPDLFDEQLVTDEVNGVWPAWNPDRTKIAFFASNEAQVANYGLYVVNVDGGGLIKLADDVHLLGWPVWSPDGTRIAFTSLAPFELENQRGIAAIHVVDANTGIETDFTSGAYHYALDPTWSPDGQRIAFITKKVYYRGAALGRRVEGAVRVLDTRTGAIADVGERQIPFADYVIWSPRDDLILVLTSELGSAWYETMITTIFMIHVSSGVIDNITDRSHTVSYPIWSPDGSRYAFTEGNNIVQVRSVEGAITWINVPRDITPFLSWSPDGSMLIAPSNSPGAASMLIDLANGGIVTDFPLRFDFTIELAGPPRWSPTSPAHPPAAPTIAGTTLDV